MKFEVYVQHIFQEYPVTEKLNYGYKTNWLKYERNCGCRGNVCMPLLDGTRSNLLRVFLRSEGFGGLLYDPTSAIIYKLDKEAFSLIQKLVDLHKEKGMEIIDSQLIFPLAKELGVKEAIISELTGKLKEANLW